MLGESSELSDQLQGALGPVFRLERELGGGGMSRVFLVFDTELERQVVVKVLPPELAAGLSVERFRREIQVGARLQHPHIVPLLTAGAKEGLLYYSMPYITGESLRARLARQGELPVGDAVRILRDVADALAHAHASGVVHRDIKPDNVLISGNHALVADFGVAKALANSAGDSSLTSVGIALGTPMYMSPEQAAADPNIDHRADIYSLGSLAYELLTGRPPFAGMPPQQVLAAHMTTAPRPVSEHRESIPPALAATVMRCLEKKPADRWQSAEELLRYFEAVATPSGGLLPTNAYPAERRPRTTRAIFAAAVGATVVVAAFVTWKLTAERPFEAVATQQITNSAGLELDAAISPDGHFVAFGAGPAGRTRIFIRQIGGGAARPLAEGAPEPQRTPRWSSDGQRISFVVGGTLYSAPAFGGAAHPVFDAGDYEFASPVLGPDGQSVAFARRDGIYLRQASGGEPIRLVAARWPNYLVWSPDGNRIAYVSDNPWFVYSGSMLGNIAPSTVWLVDVRTGEAAAVTDSTSLNAAPAWTSDGRTLLFVSSAGGGRDIYSLALSGRGRPRGPARRITTGANAHTISLSADGTRLAYTVLTSRSNIWSAPIEAHGATPFAQARAVTNENQTVEGLSVSPDGQWIAFDSNREGRQHIFKVAVSGGDPAQLTRDRADDFNPSWSGDGQFIAYHSLRTGSRNVHVINADGTGSRTVVAGPSHEMGAATSPDGKAILYISDASGRWELYYVPLDAARTPGVPRQVTRDFGYRGRWTPDGESVIYLSLVDTTLHIVGRDGSNPRLLLDGRRYGLVPHKAAMGTDPLTVYLAASDREGRYGFYRVPITGGEPRAVLSFDDPARQPRRPEFDTDGRRLFFTIATDESDVWLLQLKR
jgi:Tol biopolymer transport system component